MPNSRTGSWALGIGRRLQVRSRTRTAEHLHLSISGVTRANRVELALKRHPIEHLEPQAREDRDSCVELAKRLAEGPQFRLVRTFHGCGILDSPVRGHRL